MQGRTECEAAGQQKRLIIIDAQLKILPAQAELLGTRTAPERFGLGSPSQPSDVRHRLVGEQEAVGAKVGS